MARTLAWQTGFPVSAPGATQYTADQFKPPIPLAGFPDATRHWLFGGSSSSLVDVRSGALLTPFDAAQPPTYGSNFLTTANSGRYGLVSTMDDGQVGIEFGVFARPTLGLYQIVFGTLGSGTGLSTGGSSPFWRGDTNRLEATSRATSGAVTGTSIIPPAALDAGEAYFLAMIEMFDGTTSTRAIYLGGYGWDVRTGNRAVASPMRKRAVGNCYFTISTYLNSVKAHSYGQVDPADMEDTLAENQALVGDAFKHERLRLAEAGVTVFNG